MDLAVMSLACDLTRVVSIAFSTALNALRFTFMGMHDQDGHSLSHAGDASLELQDQWARMLTWYTDQFAGLLDRLEAIPEGEGTLLDNCLVLWCNELSRGNTHSHDDMPFILAGGAGGRAAHGASPGVRPRAPQQPAARGGAAHGGRGQQFRTPRVLHAAPAALSSSAGRGAHVAQRMMPSNATLPRLTLSAALPLR